MVWAADMNECEKLAMQMNSPSHVVNNLISPEATLIMVDSTRRHGFLLEAVQILTDLNLSIRKAYISSHGHCFMNVFHVTDQDGSKLTDNVIGYIEHYLGRLGSNVPQTSNLIQGLTELELTGTDRPGLLAEVFTVIAGLKGNVHHTKFWTHNGRYASVIFFKDEDTGSFLSASNKLARVQKRLKKVLKGDHNVRAAKATAPILADTDIERRLHQLMFADGDYELSASSSGSRHGPPEAVVAVEEWWVRGYTVVKVGCKDRQKLLFDLICAVTDMKCVIFHACVDSDSSEANLEFSIRHDDGTPISSDAETQRLIKCMRAAVNRRAFEGVMLELEAPDRRGVLADVTSIFKEKGLNVTAAEVTSSEEKAPNEFRMTPHAAAHVFHVTPHAEGHPVEAKDIEEELQRKSGQSSIKVRKRLSSALSNLRIS